MSAENPRKLEIEYLVGDVLDSVRNNQRKLYFVYSDHEGTGITHFLNHVKEELSKILPVLPLLNLKTKLITSENRIEEYLLQELDKISIKPLISNEKIISLIKLSVFLISTCVAVFLAVKFTWESEVFLRFILSQLNIMAPYELQTLIVKKYDWVVLIKIEIFLIVGITSFSNTIRMLKRTIKVLKHEPMLSGRKREGLKELAVKVVKMIPDKTVVILDDCSCMCLPSLRFLGYIIEEAKKKGKIVYIIFSYVDSLTQKYYVKETLKQLQRMKEEKTHLTKQKDYKVFELNLKALDYDMVRTLLWNKYSHVDIDKSLKIILKISPFFYQSAHKLLQLFDYLEKGEMSIRDLASSTPNDMTIILSNFNNRDKQYETFLIDRVKRLSSLQKEVLSYLVVNCRYGTNKYLLYKLINASRRKIKESIKGIQQSDRIFRDIINYQFYKAKSEDTYFFSDGIAKRILMEKWDVWNYSSNREYYGDMILNYYLNMDDYYLIGKQALLSSLNESSVELVIKEAEKMYTDDGFIDEPRELLEQEIIKIQAALEYNERELKMDFSWREIYTHTERRKSYSLGQLWINLSQLYIGMGLFQKAIKDIYSSWSILKRRYSSFPGFEESDQRLWYKAQLARFFLGLDLETEYTASKVTPILLKKCELLEGRADFIKNVMQLDISMGFSDMTLIATICGGYLEKLKEDNTEIAVSLRAGHVGDINTVIFHMLSFKLMKMQEIEVNNEYSQIIVEIISLNQKYLNYIFCNSGGRKKNCECLIYESANHLSYAMLVVALRFRLIKIKQLFNSKATFETHQNLHQIANELEELNSRIPELLPPDGGGPINERMMRLLNITPKEDKHNTEILSLLDRLCLLLYNHSNHIISERIEASKCLFEYSLKSPLLQSELKEIVARQTFIESYNSWIGEKIAQYDETILLKIKGAYLDASDESMKIRKEYNMFYKQVLKERGLIYFFLVIDIIRSCPYQEDYISKALERNYIIEEVYKESMIQVIINYYNGSQINNAWELIKLLEQKCSHLDESIMFLQLKSAVLNQMGEVQIAKGLLEKYGVVEKYINAGNIEKDELSRLVTQYIQLQCKDYLLLPIDEIIERNYVKFERGAVDKVFYVLALCVEKFSNDLLNVDSKIDAKECMKEVLIKLIKKLEYCEMSVISQAAKATIVLARHLEHDELLEMQEVVSLLLQFTYNMRMRESTLQLAGILRDIYLSKGEPQKAFAVANIIDDLKFYTYDDFAIRKIVLDALSQIHGIKPKEISLSMDDVSVLNSTKKLIEMENVDKEVLEKKIEALRNIYSTFDDDSQKEEKQEIGYYLYRLYRKIGKHANAINIENELKSLKREIDIRRFEKLYEIFTEKNMTADSEWVQGVLSKMQSEEASSP